MTLSDWVTSSQSVSMMLTKVILGVHPAVNNNVSSGSQIYLTNEVDELKVIKMMLALVGLKLRTKIAHRC